MSCSVALSKDLFVVVLEVAVEDDTEEAEELLCRVRLLFKTCLSGDSKRPFLVGEV